MRSKRLSISLAFLNYLSEIAPSLFYQASLHSISFRWKIPEQEFLIGWTSSKSGIDMIADLHTEEVCGFTGLHFPGQEFLRYLVAEHAGPYDALFVVKSLEKFLQKFGETLGLYYERILSEASKTAGYDCYLRYSTDETEDPDPVILTRQNFSVLYRPEVIH